MKRQKIIICEHKHITLRETKRLFCTILTVLYNFLKKNYLLAIPPAPTSDTCWKYIAPFSYRDGFDDTLWCVLAFCPSVWCVTCQRDKLPCLGPFDLSGEAKTLLLAFLIVRKSNFLIWWTLRFCKPVPMLFWMYFYAVPIQISMH